MKKKIIFLFTLMSLLIVSVTGNFAAAADGLADGKYTIGYTVLKGDSGSASMANDYFLKPATLNVANGSIQVQVKLKQSEWIKSLSVGGTPVKVVSEDTGSNTRIISFNVSSISNPTNANMHVLIEEQDYDHNYTVRFSFDQSSLKAVDVKQKPESQNGGTAAKTNEQTAGNSENGTSESVAPQKVENPQTGDSTSAYLLLFIVLLCSSCYFLYRLKVKHNE